MQENITPVSQDDGAYLADAIVYDSFELGKLNLVVAPCGAGKTTAAFSTIPQYLGVEPRRTLILINTTSGAESFVQDDLAYFYDYTGTEWDANFTSYYDKPIVMTYALFGAQYKKGNIRITDYDYIVCDELHALNQYIAMARGKLVKQYPQAAPWEINDMLQMTCFTYRAIEAIEKAIKLKTTWVFALTATPAQLYRGWLVKLSKMINEVQYSQKLHAYDILQTFEYAEIEPILRAVVSEQRKRLFFFHTIKELQQYKKILIECGRAAEALWSVSSDCPMDSHGLTTRDFILAEHRFPDDVQDLLINSAYETAISIKDPSVQEVYIHSGNSDTRQQARNRLRQDVEVVGYYNSSMHKDHSKLTLQKQALETYIQMIPSDYFDVPLNTEDKKQLIEAIGFPKKWTSLKQALIKAGYKVIEKNTKGQRTSVICTTTDLPNHATKITPPLSI